MNCHGWVVGRPNCFFTSVRDGTTEIIQDVAIDPAELYADEAGKPI